MGALGPLTEEGAKQAWTAYFCSDDIQATAHAAVVGGGTARARSSREGAFGGVAPLQGGQEETRWVAASFSLLVLPDSAAWPATAVASLRALPRTTFHSGAYRP
jgi:hypothetical protein